ncbi:uncharacterized protein DUF547 [Neolewinella xylanilytica]|uniref:Uncharacterized protein DUF547 n=1 Tax=Neolewinella xylanilytica TaxID=1514080 RepID=A0A2S6I681_9BACT|nr:DUF547 domain-containing protein [Neolewinella xylanilytica]PPK86655.1 uncharacterized protein DUF547 [Neolewinella xylanilytica]
MFKAFTLICIFPLLLGCTEGPPADVQGAESVSEPIMADTIVQDQIEYTREQTPEAPPQETLVREVASPLRPAVAPPPPTNKAPAPISTPAAQQPIRPQGPSHAAWSSLLSRHVSGSGTVNYAGFRQDVEALNGYLSTLAEEVPDNSWSNEEALAYWINAYNAFTIKLILDNWSVKSIREIDEPWDQKFITLDGDAYSLNQIEHEIIRPNFAEPRIHFALVCAAVSCPPLATSAYTAENLDAMLERQTRNFINNEEFNVTQEEVVRVSPLFDWYAEDFGNVTEFLNRYLRTDIPTKKQLYFLEYDWSLNGGV